MSDFENGVVSMARNCLPAISLIRKGKWTLDDLKRWLEAVVENDPGYAQRAQKEILELAETPSPNEASPLNDLERARLNFLEQQWKSVRYNA